MKTTLHLAYHWRLLNYILVLIFYISSSSNHLFAQEEIDVIGNIQSIVDGDISPSLLDRTDFDFALVGGGTKVNTFIIENTGSSPLTINSIIGTGDFANIGILDPTGPIPAGGSATFTVTFSPSVVGLRTGTITIDNSDADEGTYNFDVQGTGSSTGMSTWDPLLYPPTPCSWTSQDNNGVNSPYASWNLAVQDAEAGTTNNIISLQPDAYVGSFDYDNANGNESCVGHQVATTLDVNAAQNGLQILGSNSGCLTFIDLSSGSSTDQWGNFTNMNGLTIRNIYLRGWGGGINLTNCSNVVIEDCVFESCNNSATNAVFLTGCSNVVFRRCAFLGNVNPAGRALRVDNSGTAGNRILFEDCTYGCNSSNSQGAGLFVGDGAFVQVNGAMFSGNDATNAGKGGGAYVAVGGDVVFDDCDFIDNTSSSAISTEGGGAIYVDGNSNTTQTTVLINACHFYENTSLGAVRGGAVACVGNSSNVSRSQTTVQNSIFERNGGDRGGAFWAQNATATINNNFFIDNQASSLSGNNSRGGALYFQNAAGNYTITNNTFQNNLSSSGQIGRNDTGCGGCFGAISGNNYNGQSQVNLANTGGTAGWSLTPASLATVAATVDCSTGSFCAFTLSGSCLSNSQSSFICSPSAANSASISGQVWEDDNGNGIQEGTDDGISNAFVLLYDESGYLVGSTNTDASGNYLFSNVLPGNYRVVFINPDISTYLFMSPANAGGSTETTDSDQESETIIASELRGATSANINVVAGSSANDIDAGFSTVTLPIELHYFTAKKQNNNSLLQWSTESELNNDYFSIQRSKDGIEWFELGQQTGAKNSFSMQYYQFVDEAPLQGINYYRLVQFDLDGHNSHSQTLAVEHQISSNLQVYPNPVKDVLTLEAIELASFQKDIELYNMAGMAIPINMTVLGDNLAKINVQNLDAGVYFIRIKNNGSTQQFKFIKL